MDDDDLFGDSMDESLPDRMGAFEASPPIAPPNQQPEMPSATYELPSYEEVINDALSLPILLHRRQ